MADETEKKAESQGALVPTTQQLGQAIITEAQKAYDDDRKAAVVTNVKRLMQMRDEAEDKIVFYKNAVEWYTRKLAALEAGEFAMNRSNAQLTFGDPDLNRGNY